MRASDSIKAADASGDKVEMAHAYVELGDAYWILDKRDQAALMYENFVDLDLDRSYFPA